MTNNALIMYGSPRKKEDFTKFEKDKNRDIQLMSEIASASGYESKVISDSYFHKAISEHLVSDSFLFYFTGHANETFLGGYRLTLERTLKSIAGLKGKKIVILDACISDFIKQGKIPKDILLFGTEESSPSRSLAMSFYDAVIYRGKKLSNINEETFQEMKHNWIKARGGQ
jgi:hypothetical protein